MAEVKLDLLDDLFSSKLSDHSWNPDGKVISDETSMFLSMESEEEKSHGLQHDSKGIADQIASENSMPLSPQWLYSKPTDVKDARAAASLALGNYNCSSPNDGWHLDGSKGKKELRSVSSVTEGNRRWHEEERETGLFGAKRDHRKVDCRADGPATKESTHARSVPQSVQRHESGNRNSGHETRRDSKWSSRWGPNERVKESRTEKKVDVDKEKDCHSDVQLSSTISRSACDRESDTHERWRPRHRTDMHSVGSTLLRTAPGFGNERGRMEGENLGFAIGRGRSNAGSLSSDHPHKTASGIGKPTVGETYCYPRGKLLDIYRFHMDGPCFSTMPDEMAEFLPISDRCVIKPCAFIPPDTKEQVILLGISNGKITNGEVGPKSHFLMEEKKRQSENTSDTVSCEFAKEKVTLSPILCEEAPTNRESISVVELQDNDFSSSHSENSHVDLWESHDDLDGRKKLNLDELASLDVITDSSFSSTSVLQTNLPDDSSSLFMSFSTQKNQSPDLKTHANSQIGVRFENLYVFYVDPNAMIQGPFLGADVLLWLEEGYFGTDLPVLLADAPEGTPFRALGEVMQQLKYPEYGGELPLTSLSQAGSSTLDDIFQPLLDLNLSPHHHPQWRTAAPEAPLKPHVTGSHGFHDSVIQEEEIVFPGRAGTVFPAKHYGNDPDPLLKANSLLPFSNQSEEPTLSCSNDIKCHPFGLYWSELDESSSFHKRIDMPKLDSFASMNDPSPSFRSSNVNPMAVGHLSATEQGLLNDDLLLHFGSQQFQRQQHFQQRNELPYQTYLNDSLLQSHLPSYSELYPDHVQALQLHEHLQLPHQQQRALQHKLQLQLLQEHKQSQIRQVLVNQLMQEQLSAPHQHSLNRTEADVLGLYLAEQQLLRSCSASMAAPAEHFAGPHQIHGQAQQHPLLLQQEQQLQMQQLLRELQQQRAIDEKIYADQYRSFLAGDQRGHFELNQRGHLELNQRGHFELNQRGHFELNQRGRFDHPKESCYEPGSMIADQVNLSRFDAMGDGWSKGNQLQSAQIGAEDPRLWGCYGKFDDHTSKQLLMELLHQESGGQSSVSDFSFGPAITELPMGVVSREGDNEKRDLIEDVFSWRCSGSGDCLSRGLSSFETLDHGAGHGRAWLEDAGLNEIPVDALSGRSSSAGAAGFYEDTSGLPDSCAGLDTKNQVVVSINGQDIVLVRRSPTPCPSSSQEELSRLLPGAPVEERSSSHCCTLPAGMNQMSHCASIATTANKEMLLGRSCFIDAGQPSFLDIVKNGAGKTSKSEAVTAPCLSEQLARSGKKKGKKGKQIDPALLGFRVMSNRIMMGEIQRLED